MTLINVKTNETKVEDADCVMVATGRIPNVEEL